MNGGQFAAIVAVVVSAMLLSFLSLAMVVVVMVGV